MKKRETKKRIAKIKATCIKVILLAQLIILYTLPVLADTKKTDKSSGGLQGSKLVTGTIALLTDARLALILVESGFAAFLEVKEGMAYQASEEQEKAMHKKKMISILVLAILIVSITALIPTILAYYQE